MQCQLYQFWYFLHFGHLKLKERHRKNWKEFQELFKISKTCFILRRLNPNLFSLSTWMQRAQSVTVCSFPLGLEIAHIYGSLIFSQWELSLDRLRLAMQYTLAMQVNKPFNSWPKDVMKSLSPEIFKSRVNISLEGMLWHSQDLQACLQ